MNQDVIRSVLLSSMLIISMNLYANEHLHQHSADNQKQTIGHMHHKLEDDQAPYKTKEAQALKELNEMTIREDVRIEDVHAKIDELMAAKNQIMRLRYEHLIEMRQTLTDEQKAKYDQNVLTRSEVR